MKTLIVIVIVICSWLSISEFHEDKFKLSILITLGSIPCGVRVNSARMLPVHADSEWIPRRCCKSVWIRAESLGECKVLSISVPGGMAPSPPSSTSISAHGGGWSLLYPPLPWVWCQRMGPPPFAFPQLWCRHPSSTLVHLSFSMWRVTTSILAPAGETGPSPILFTSTSAPS